MAQIRGPGIPLPPDSPQNTGRPGVITLPSGGIYVMPQGDYLLAAGGQTVLQWWDPNNNQWRAASPPGSMSSFTSDGGNYRMVNMSGVCVGAAITNAGSGGTNGIGPAQTGATVTFGAPAAGGVTATAQGYLIVGGSVPAPTVTQAGSGFLVPPLICCDPPPQGGIQATFTCTITAAGLLNAITQVNPGAGYTSIPQFYIIPQPQFSQQEPQYPGAPAPPAAGSPGQFPAPGLIHPSNVWPGTPYQANISTSGALLTGNALTGSGTLTGIVMTYYGNGYLGNAVPAVSFSGGNLAGGVAATAIMSMCAIAAIGGTVTASGGAGQIANTPSISSLGLIAGIANNTQFWPRPIRGINSGASGSFTLEDPGFGLQGGAVFVSAGTSTTVATITNTQYGGRTDTSVLQSSVNS